MLPPKMLSAVKLKHFLISKQDLKWIILMFDMQDTDLLKKGSDIYILYIYLVECGQACSKQPQNESF